MATYGKHVRVWKESFGDIPKDVDGRSYEIHHIDGNPDNNTLENLMCVSIDEHYKIHLEKGEFGAAFLIAGRMKRKPEDIAEVARKGTLERVKNGTHNFLDPNFPRSMDHNIGYVVALDTRTNEVCRISKEDFDTYDHYVGVNTNRKMKSIHKNRGHNRGKRWKQSAKRQNIVTCPHCDKSGDASGLKRWHFDNCKQRIENE